MTDKNLVSANQIKVVRASSENLSNNKLAINAIDGDPRTVWHTQFTSRLAEHPHELILDLGRERTIRGFRYLARQDNSWNGAFSETEFSVSNSPDKFPEPVVSVTFEKVRKVQGVDCDEVIRGRYVRIRIRSEVNGNPWSSAAEIGVIEK